MSRVGVLGSLSVDHVVRAYGEARYGCLGGPGLYASLGAMLVHGVSVRLACRIPDDTPAFRQMLDGVAVDLRHCASEPRAARLWILYSAEGRRIVPTAPPRTVETADPDELGGEAYEPDAAFFDGLDAALTCAPRHGIRSLFDRTVWGVDPDQREVRSRGWGYWKEIAAGTDVLLPSRVQLRLLGDDPVAAARELSRRLNISVVARLDRDGALAIGDGGCWIVRDSRVRVVDPTGAGDAMAGATMAGRAAGRCVAESAALGVSAARLALAGWGPDGLIDRPTPMTRPLEGVEVVRC